MEKINRLRKVVTESVNPDQGWFFFVLLYLVIDYGRPQDIFPIGFLRPAMIVFLLLIGFLISRNGLAQSNCKQTKMIWLFIILLATYIPFAVNNYFAFTTTKGMFTMMPFILSVIICVNSIKRLKKLILFCICIMIYVSCYALSHGGKGSGSYFADENDLSLYINMWLPFCYFLLIAEKKKIRRIIYASGLVVGLLSIVASFSRGGFIGLLAISTVIWLSSPKKIVSAILISILAILFISFGDDAYWAEMSTITDTGESTATARIESWKSATRMFIDNPLGVGGNNFLVRFPEYQSSCFQRGMWGRVAHSLWFTLIPELGIFGIIIYFSLLYYNLQDIFMLRRLKKHIESEDMRYLYYLSLAFLASLSGYFASGTFLSVLYYAHYWYLTGIIVAAVRVAKNLLDSEHGLIDVQSV